MSDKAIILSVILAAVLCVAVPFIFRVCRYRRRMKTLIVPDGPSGEVAVGTVVGLIGGIKVYNKFSSGDPDTSKTAASWFGACIFLIVAATILRSFFL